MSLRWKEDCYCAWMKSSMVTSLFHGSWFVFVSLFIKFTVLSQAGFRLSVTCHIFQVFLGALSFVYFAKALAEGYLKSTITQIERRFDIPSSLVGIIDGSFEIGMYYRYLTLLLSTKFLGMTEGHPHCTLLSALCVKSDFMCKILFGHNLPRPWAAMCTYVLSHVRRFCDSSDRSPPGSSVHWISQARILEWVAISFLRESSRSRDRTQVSCIAGGFLTTEPPGKPCATRQFVLSK